MYYFLNSETCFFSLLNWEGDQQRIELLIESLRTFGGKFKDFPVWIFTIGDAQYDFSRFGNTRLIPLEIPQKYQQILFAPKVFASAMAEKIASKADIRSLIWFGSS